MLLLKLKRLILLIFTLLVFKSSHSQSTCPPNIDFENGDFSSWECFTGKTSVINNKNIMTLTLSGSDTTRHKIISSKTDKDPYGKFPQLCPYGGNYSVKLGNEGTGSEAEALSFTFTVPTTVDTFTFTYFYAVVFQDPQHAIYEQPRFFVTAYDVASGNPIKCASFDYVANGAIPGFQKSTLGTDILFKDWSPASLQFAGLAGRAVRLEFRTADCTRGGHFGYAYVDVASGCSNILATAPFCAETNSLLLNAPYGFKNYTWYDETFSKVIGNNQQSITLSPAPATSGVFHVDVEPYPGYGCRDTFHAVVKALPVPVQPDAQTTYGYCQYQTASKLTATAIPGNELLWYTTLGGPSSFIAPVPPTDVPGVFTYYVSQKVLFGCESFPVKITITVTPKPVPSFKINTLRQCQNGNNYTFTSSSTNKFNPSYSWDFGDGNTQAGINDSIVNYTYKNNGNFTVKLTVLNDSACSTTQPSVITVVPKPIASYTFPPVICEKQTNVTITDNSSVPGGVAVITKWWWQINGNTYNTKAVPAFIPATTNQVPVRQVVTTTEGCISDTVSISLNVHYQPKAAFSYSQPLCENEVIKFANKSFFNQAPASETLVKWYWKFNSFTSSAEHPALNLPPGNYSTKLISESNFGCKSPEIDSQFIVHPKPHIQLDINDSCIFRSIRYKAIDKDNNVDQWYWNMGAGLRNDNTTLIERIYYKEGYHPLTLIGQTQYACKDTVIRPFTIYDNKAKAGKDTTVAMGEPVHLDAHGVPGSFYMWTPPTGLDSNTIEKPTATLDYEQLYRLHSLTKEGCDNDSKILIKRYKGPELYIPSAFTPNNDKVNDALKVIPIGIKTFGYFAVYTRLGELVFRTTDYHQGWDGKNKGVPMDMDTFVAISEAIDYKGNPMFKKQTVILIR